MAATTGIHEVYHDWLTTKVLVPPHEMPRTLWHYTTAAGLQGIIESNSLWATKATFLNDVTETTHGITQFTTMLQRHREDAQGPLRKFLDFFCDHALPLYLSTMTWTRHPIFVTCFCADGDLLSQWRGYGGIDSAGGYAIGFTPPGSLHAWTDTAPDAHRLAIRRVVYDEPAQQEVCEHLIAAVLAALGPRADDILAQGQAQTALVDGLFEVATWFKHPAFREEDEWRVVYVRSTDPDPLPLRHRASGGLLIPYVALSLPAMVGVHATLLPISNVNCGPSPDSGRKSDGVSGFLVDGGFDHVVVTASSAPVRLT